MMVLLEERFCKMKKFWDNLLNEGPKFGYHPNATKTVLIVKRIEDLPKARAVFKDTGVLVKIDGERHLGAVLPIVLASKCGLRGGPRQKILNLVGVSFSTQLEASLRIYVYDK